MKSFQCTTGKRTKDVQQKNIEQELKLRKHAGYPPYTDMIRLLVRGENVKNRAEALKKLLEAKSSNLQSIDNHVLDSCNCSPTLFSSGRDWQVLLT